MSIYYRDQPPLEFKNRRIADDNNYLLAENFARSIDGQDSPVLDCIEARNICATVKASQSSRLGKPIDVKNRKMNPEEFCKALKSDKRMYGTLVVSTSPFWPKVIGDCGLDFIFIDTEHIAISRETLS